jgi:hypothetical protein
VQSNPTVYCALHAVPFAKTDENVDNDGTQTLISQIWEAACGCKVEITLALPLAQ